jgi:hypothetical protein
MARALHAAALLAATAALAGAPPALAEPVAMVSEPLTVHVAERGQLQAFRAGEATGMFFPPAATTGDAGFFLAFPAGAIPPPPAAVAGRVYGFQGGSGPTGLQDYSLGTHGPVTGSGTPGDPLTQQTTYGVPDVAEVTQTTTYVAGQETFTVQWAVRNVTPAPLTFKALAAADFFFEGSDRGTGVYTDGPPRFVGGTNAGTGRSGGFAELPALSELWSHYEALAFGGLPMQVWGKVRAAGESPAASLADTVLGELADNAGAVEWDGRLTAPLPGGQTARFAVTVRSAVPAALQLTPSNAAGRQGEPLAFTATARDTADVPFADRTVRFTILGANAGSGEAQTDAAGAATLFDPGMNAGTDTLVAYVDLNGSGTREPTEPQASALAMFADATAPRCAVRIRPDGSRPLRVTVRCGEQVRVTIRTTLAVPRSGRRIRLRRAAATVVPGRSLRTRVRLPAAVRARYAGRVLTAIVTVTARDAAGNIAADQARRRIRLQAAE